jgi:hypothetical protein
MNLQEQVRLHKSLSRQIEALESQKKQLSATILREMTEKTLHLGPYHVKRCSRLSIKLSLDQARTYHAVKLEETIDKDKIKLLYKSGYPIPNVSENEYIQIFECL